MKTSNIHPKKIFKGNTQFGVNHCIIQFLAEWMQKKPLKRFLDAPCGQCEFIQSLMAAFPEADVEGHDLYCTPHPEVAQYFHKTDLKNLFNNLAGQKFDVITNISGVMVTDHVSSFIGDAREHLNSQGLLIITNDNILTLRDRFSFLFFGHTKRFRLFYSTNEGNWNLVLIQGLWKNLKEQKYQILKVEYLSIYKEDYLWLPIALLFYPLLFLQIKFGKGDMDLNSRKMLFSFKSLLARHYIIFAQKN